MALCPHCGLEIAADDAFCKHCGAKLGAGREPSKTMEALAAEFESVVSKHPNDADARYSLALAFFYNEHWASAAEQLRRVVELQPNFADAYARLVVCLARMGKGHEAVATVEAGLAIAPHHEDLVRLKEQLDDLMKRHE